MNSKDEDDKNASADQYSQEVIEESDNTQKIYQEEQILTETANLHNSTIPSNKTDNDALIPNKQGTLKKLKDHSKAIILSLIGMVSASALPIWQIYFVETSDIHTQIVAINRVESEAFQVPLDTDELLNISLFHRC